MVQGEAGPSVCYDPCGPQKSGPALLKGFGATSMASSARAQRPLYCRASGNRPGRVGCACVWVTPVAMWGQERIAKRAVGEARTACLAAHRAEVSTEATGGASAWGSALGDAAEEPCTGDRGVRLLRHRDEYLPTPVCVGGDGASQPAADSWQRDGPSTAAWTRQQLREALGVDSRYSYLIHDRDKRHRARQRR